MAAARTSQIVSRKSGTNENDIMPPMPTRPSNANSKKTAGSSPDLYEANTVTFKLSHFYAVLVVLAFAAGILIGYVAWGRDTVVAVAAEPQAVAPAAPTAVPEPVVYKIETDGYPSTGPDDAPVTIVEFSDYQCPFCARWHNQEWQRLLDAYPDKIRFVYRNFPLSFHPNAMPAAEAALCAGDQDSYWQYHDVLFENQPVLNDQAGTVLEQATYTQYAADLGLDVTAFETCMTSHKYQQFIQDDMAYAASLPASETGEPAVAATPTFFINGHRLVGAYPIENFRPIIDAELEAAG
jgi:protein-disulfide isomerase